MTAHTALTSSEDGQPARKKNNQFLRSAGLLAQRPIIGWLLFIFGSLIFAGLTYNLFAQGPLLAWDRALAATLPAAGLKSPAFVQTIMDAGFYIGKEVTVVLAILLSFYFIRRRYWQELTMLTIGMIGTSMLFSILSTWIGRERPSTQIWIVVNIAGFPSGHAMSSVTFYGLLAYLLVPHMPTAFGKTVVKVAAIGIIAFIGFSRIFTGGHYLTDVLSGYAVGIAWFGAAYTLIEILSKKRRSQNGKKETVQAG